MSRIPSAVRGALVGAAAALVVLGLVIVAIGTGLVGGDDAGGSPTAASDGTRIGEASSVTNGRQGGAKRSRIRAAVEPTGLTVPALGLKARVMPIEVSPEGVLDPPGDVSQVGWWQRSARVGAKQGQTVLTGHSVHTGGGVMDDLEQLSRGDEVKVFHDGARKSYAVTSVRTWSKATLAEKAEDIFAQDRQKGRLVLVTCEDWNGVTWESNVVVFAKPLKGSKPRGG